MRKLMVLFYCVIQYMCVHYTPHGCQYTVRPDCDLVIRNVPIDGNVFAPLRTIVELQDLS